MPASPESYRLAQRHRDDQLRNAESYKGEFAALWVLWRASQTPAQRRGWLSANVNLIKRYRQRAQAIAQRYYQRARSMDASGPLPKLPPVDQASDAELVKNLLDRSAGVYKKARLNGFDEFEAEEKARKATEASGQRLVLNGGRDAIEQFGKSDKDALGWMRVSDGDPCAFCALLISRGAVYRSRESAGGGMFRFHDRDGCTVAPVFTRDEFLSPEAKKYRQMYEDATQDEDGNVVHTGAAARNEFRRALEGREDGPRRT